LPLLAGQVAERWRILAGCGPYE